MSPANGVYIVDLTTLKPTLTTGTTYTLVIYTYGATGFGSPFSNYQVDLTPNLQFADGTVTTSGRFTNPNTLKLNFQAISSTSCSPLTITTDTLPDKNNGDPYTLSGGSPVKLSATGGTLPYKWSILSNTANGLTITDSSAGILGDVSPAVAIKPGQVSVSIQVQDSTGQSSAPKVLKLKQTCNLGKKIALLTQYDSSVAGKPYDHSFLTPKSYPTLTSPVLNSGEYVVLTYSPKDGSGNSLPATPYKISLTPQTNTLTGFIKAINQAAKGKILAAVAPDPKVSEEGPYGIALHGAPGVPATITLGVTNSATNTTRVIPVQPRTIGNVGCALTTLDMALQYAGAVFGTGAEADALAGDKMGPSELNDFMGGAYPGGKYPGMGFDKNSDVLFALATKWVGWYNSLQLKLMGTSGVDSITSPDNADTEVQNALCAVDPHPYIIGVNLSPATNGAYRSSHYILLTGRDVKLDGSPLYEIADPGHPYTTLDSYNNQFLTRGWVQDPPGDLSLLSISVGGTADVAVYDSLGNRTGLNPTANVINRGIPNSSYDIDSLSDDVTGAPPDSSSKTVTVRMPVSGQYRIVISGTGDQGYGLSIGGVSTDGSPQNPTYFSDAIETGQSITFTVTFSPDPGANLAASQIVGDVNGDGDVDCTDLTIIKASLAKVKGQPGFDPRADVNTDGVVDVRDLAFVSQHLSPNTHCQ